MNFLLPITIPSSTAPSKHSTTSLNGNSPNFHHRRRNGGGSVTSHDSPSSLSREMMFVPCPHRNHVTLGKLEKLSLTCNQLNSVVVTRDHLVKLGQAADTQSVSLSAFFICLNSSSYTIFTVIFLTHSVPKQCMIFLFVTLNMIYSFHFFYPTKLLSTQCKLFL